MWTCLNVVTPLMVILLQEDNQTRKGDAKPVE